jgi:anti-sigma-K factor RskA
MNVAPDNPELIDRLAAEYVLGTLRGAARRRLERWRASSALIEARCRFWEERLMPLLRTVNPLPPPAHVWRDIEQRLGLARTQSARGRLLPFALAASLVAVLALATLFYLNTPSRPAAIATIAAPAGTLMWQVEVSAEANPRIDVRSSAAAAQPAGHDYELWALPKGGKPVSLGLMPYAAHSARRALTESQQQALASASQLAVSLEPAGGSPTGQPTGAVVFVVALQKAG